jgi:methane monooxygenase component A beta chain
MIQTQRVFINKILPSFPQDMDGPKAAWMTDPVYQPARETVQELWQGTFDWAEIVWSVHGVFDPIFGQFVRREFFSRIAPLYGDTLTPWIQSQAIQYFETAKKGTKKMMVDVLMEDAHYGDHNRVVVNAWTEKWLPDTIKSLKGFMGAYAQLPHQVEGFTDEASVRVSVNRVISDWAEDYAHAINFKVDVDAMVNEVMSGYRGE